MVFIARPQHLFIRILLQECEPTKNKTKEQTNKTNKNKQKQTTPPPIPPQKKTLRLDRHVD